MIPKGASVAHGSSTTLEQIGFIERVNNPASGYRYLNAEWRDESDPIKRNRIRGRLSVEADFFLGSVQALAETGEAVAAGRHRRRPGSPALWAPGGAVPGRPGSGRRATRRTRTTGTRCLLTVTAVTVTKRGPAKELSTWTTPRTTLFPGSPKLTDILSRH